MLLGVKIVTLSYDALSGTDSTSETLEEYHHDDPYEPKCDENASHKDDSGGITYGNGP